jgi:hypothetical protein
MPRMPRTDTNRGQSEGQNTEPLLIAAAARACACGKRLPAAASLHVYKCECGRVWLRPDCSEVCAAWQAC